MNDAKFLKAFFGMLGALVVLALLLIVIAAIMGSGTSKKLDAERMQSMNERLAERIQPAGTLKVGLAQPAAGGSAGGAMETAEASEVPSGEQVYDGTCSACHASGAAGAPMLTDAEAWAPRLEKGQETLTQHALNGFNAMPAKGGNTSLSDEAVSAAVAYMTQQARQ